MSNLVQQNRSDIVKKGQMNLTEPDDFQQKDFALSLINDRVVVVTDQPDSGCSGFTNLNKNYGGPDDLNTSLSDCDVKSVLCGFPAFCTNSALTACSNTPLANCEACNLCTAIIFGVIVGALGLTIVLSNAAVLHYCLKKKFRNVNEKIKSSLAIADILTGFQTLIVALYNLSWNLLSSSTEIDEIQLKYRGSAVATVAGSLYLLGFSSSLYHLVLLSQQRLHAIAFPINYKLQSSSTTHALICIVWTASIASAALPIWFPDVFTFTYSHTIFLFNLAMTEMGSADYYPMAIFVAVVFLGPFGVMTLLTGLAAAALKIKMTESGKMLSPKWNRSKQNHQRKELHVLKSLVFMQLGFAITLLPVVAVVMLDYAKVLNCGNVSTPFLICFYISMSNSLANVVVYSYRDENFRGAIANYFPSGRKESKTDNTAVIFRTSRSERIENIVFVGINYSSRENLV